MVCSRGSTARVRPGRPRHWRQGHRPDDARHPRPGAVVGSGAQSFGMLRPEGKTSGADLPVTGNVTRVPLPASALLRPGGLPASGRLGAILARYPCRAGADAQPEEQTKGPAEPVPHMGAGFWVFMGNPKGPSTDPTRLADTPGPRKPGKITAQKRQKNVRNVALPLKNRAL